VRHTSYRRWIGASFGAALGLSYGLVSQTINHFYLPGIPLFQPPGGLLGNILLWTVVSTLLGLISAWSAESIRDVFICSAFASLIIAAITLMSGNNDQEDLAPKMMSLIFLLVPLTAALVPFFGILRWATNREVEFHITHSPFLRRLLVPAVLVLVVGALGAISLHSDPARVQITSMHTMLQSGLRVDRKTALPAPLQDDLVGEFLEHASQRYQIAWDNKNNNQYGIPRRMSSRGWEEAAVTAHFDDGWMLVCLYPDSQAEPSCGGFLEE